MKIYIGLLLLLGILSSCSIKSGGSDPYDMKQNNVGARIFRLENVEVICYEAVTSGGLFCFKKDKK